MPNPHRTAALILAALIALACAPVSLVLDRPTPTAAPPATSSPTAQPTPAPTAPPPTEPSPTPLPTQASSPATPTPAQPFTSPLPFPPGERSKLGVHGIWSNHILDFTQTLADAGVPFRIVKAVDDLGWLKEIKRI